jgi:2-amino-4-hydroxy-6-hydroxymethyldihydropteridine diphosphokinase
MDQPDYCNAVALGRTCLGAASLLAFLHAIEAEQGRQRTPAKRWSARVLDLDLLTFADEVHATAKLSLPHPGIAQRNFVVLPWLSIDPDACLPDGRRLAELARGMPRLPSWQDSVAPLA